MSSLYGSIEALWSKMVMKKPSKSIYEERINCFKKLIEFQERLKTMESGAPKIPQGTEQAKETQSPTQTQQTQSDPQKEYMEHMNQYKKEYELCEIIMKPK